MFIVMHFDYFIHSCNHHPKHDKGRFPHPRVSSRLLCILFYAQLSEPQEIFLCPAALPPALPRADALVHQRCLNASEGFLSALLPCLPS